jgi:hypothetical protein
MKVFCKACHVELSSELTPLPYLSFANEKVEEAYVTEGFYLISDGRFFPTTHGCVIINEADLRNARNHSDLNRLAGYCGPSGHNGKNQVCSNGHEIATKYADCTTVHAIIFDKSATYYIAY